MKELKLNKKLKVLKMIDKTDNHGVKVERLFDMSFRLLLVGKSGVGKSNLLGNIMLNEKFKYKNLFEGDRIFIFAPSVMADEKLKTIVEEMDIPNGNIFNEYSDELLLNVYDLLIEDFKDRMEDKEKIFPFLFIIDDFAFSGKFASRFNALAKVFCNSRKFSGNVICLSQTYTQVAKNIRNQATGMIIFNTNNRELNVIEEENNFLEDKKTFMKMFRENVKEKHDFFVINYSNKHSEMYLDKNFDVISMNPNIKNVE